MNLVVSKSRDYLVNIKEFLFSGTIETLKWKWELDSGVI
jgi:hypothetical protein